jgi:purine-binding chemotaxis protein CheW
MSANEKDLLQSEEPQPETGETSSEVPEWDPVAAFGEFPADPEPDGSASEQEAGAPIITAVDAPAFEMPPSDFSLEFEGGEDVEPVSEIPVLEASPADLPELPTDLPEWDPASFSGESIGEPMMTEVLTAERVVETVTETTVWTSPPVEMADIPEPVFDMADFAPEPESAEPLPQAPLPVAPIAAPSRGESSGLERVLATIDAEVAASAPRPAASGATSTVMGTSYVGFLHGAGRYAFPIEGITEITRSVRTTPVPFTPEWVVGVTNLRGDILAVADFGLMLGNGAVASRDTAYMIVLQGKRTPFSLGLLVDAVTGMRMLGEGDVLTPTAPLGDRVTHFAQGVTGAGAELTVVLDVEAFLALPEMQQFSQN